jgi:hypothetical protein
MPKIELSETLRILTSKLQGITGGEVELNLEIDTPELTPGSDLEARALVRCPSEGRTLEYLRLDVEGVVQVEDGWRDYRQVVETAQKTEMPADHEFVVPMLVQIPENAVLTEDGANWVIEARAALDRTLDTRARAEFDVVEAE